MRTRRTPQRRIPASENPFMYVRRSSPVSPSITVTRTNPLGTITEIMDSTTFNQLADSLQDDDEDDERLLNTLLNFKRNEEMQDLIELLDARVSELETKLEPKVKNKLLAAVNDDCPICMDTLFASKSVLTTPCAHKFHAGCVIEWLNKSATKECPVCRAATIL